MLPRKVGAVTLLLGFAVLTGFAASTSFAASSAALTAAQRQAIRSMPLVNRPNRPGHIYGNNVRRLYNLRAGRR